MSGRATRDEDPIEPNQYQHRTGAGKLRGEYYTPDELVTLMLDGLQLTPRHVIIDPACGDGSFLRGAVATVAKRFCGADRRALAWHWADRIIGFDVNPEAVAHARASVHAAFREYLATDIPEEQLRIQPLDIFRCARLPQLLKAAGVGKLARDERLIIIGNPPYVEAKRLSREAKDQLRSRYPVALAGAPDLYLYFLYVCCGWLRAEDSLAFVLPNKLLVNANAQAIREWLLKEERLRRLWFATQAAIFPDAAVYPIVLFAGGPGSDGTPRVETSQLTRTPQGIRQAEAVEVDTGWYSRTRARAFFPPPETVTLREALETLLCLPEAARLDHLLDIRWTVSFHKAGLREQYVLPERPDDPLARRFLGGGSFAGNGEVTRYRIEWAGWWIRYDAPELKARKSPLPDPALFEAPKLVICQNGRTLRAAYDEQGFVLKDTFLCGAIREVDHPLCRHPRALVGLLCSRAVHFFYSHVFYGGHVNGGYLHFLRSFLVDVPIGAWTEAQAGAVAKLARQREEAETEEDRQALEEEISTHVSTALGLGAGEQAAIADWAAADANWQARERVRGVKLIPGAV